MVIFHNDAIDFEAEGLIRNGKMKISQEQVIILWSNNFWLSCSLSHVLAKVDFYGC